MVPTSILCSVFISLIISSIYTAKYWGESAKVGGWLHAVNAVGLWIIGIGIIWLILVIGALITPVDLSAELEALRRIGYTIAIIVPLNSTRLCAMDLYLWFMKRKR